MKIEDMIESILSNNMIMVFGCVWNGWAYHQFMAFLMGMMMKIQWNWAYPFSDMFCGGS